MTKLYDDGISHAPFAGAGPAKFNVEYPGTVRTNWQLTKPSASVKIFVGTVHHAVGFRPPASRRTKQGADPESMIGNVCAGSLHKFSIVCCIVFTSQTTQGPTDGVGDGEGEGEGLGVGLGDGLGLGLGLGTGLGVGEMPGDGEGLVGGDTGGMTKQAVNGQTNKKPCQQLRGFGKS